MPYARRPIDRGLHLNACLVAGVVTGLTGVSYLLERYSSPAALKPFALLDWLPGHNGQLWWAWLYLVGGAVLALLGAGVYMPRWFRTVFVVFGVGVWGGWGAGSAVASLVGPTAPLVGSFGSIAALGMVLCLLLVVQRVVVETPRDRAHKHR